MNRYLTLVLLLLVFPAQATEREGRPPREGFYRSFLTDEVLPLIKEEVALAEEVLSYGKGCFLRAQSMDEANACNAHVRKMAEEREFEEFEVDDFSKWDEQERTMVLGEIQPLLDYTICVRTARNYTEAERCEPPPEFDDE